MRASNGLDWSEPPAQPEKWNRLRYGVISPAVKPHKRARIRASPHSAEEEGTLENLQIVNRRARTEVGRVVLAVVGLCLLGSVTLMAKKKGHPASFLPQERQIIIEFFQGHSSGLPPGLAKRGGDLPPGLQKHLARNGTLPPGLQKRLQPFPVELERRLPSIPRIWVRVILGRHVILLERRTNRILDLIEIVIAAP